MPNAEAALTTARLYTHPMRRLPALALVPLLAGCSLISLDLTPRIEPLREQTVEGRGRAKILLLDISGFLSDEGGPPSLVIGGPTPPRVPLLVRVREELTQAAADPEVRRSEEHTSELQSQSNLVCRLLLEKKKKKRERRS